MGKYHGTPKEMFGMFARDVVEMVGDTIGIDLNEFMSPIQPVQEAAIPYKYRLIIKQELDGSGPLGIIERDSYVVKDGNGNLIYMVKGTWTLGKHFFIVRDMKKNVLASVRKRIVNAPGIFRRKRRKCTVALTNKKPFAVKTYEKLCMTDSLKLRYERVFETTRDGMKIKMDKSERELKVYFKQNKKPMIHIYRRGAVLDKYEVGFDDTKCHLLAILMTVAWDTMCYVE